MPDTKTRSTKATALLREDHRKVRRLFSEYEDLEDDAKPEEKKALFDAMNRELTIHATIEEEIFYPAMEEVRSEDADELVKEAEEEHKIVKTLLEELSALDPSDEQYDAKVKVLTENVRHHAEEEEEEMFPHFDDLPKERQEQISERLKFRKIELMGEMDQG